MGALCCRPTKEDFVVDHDTPDTEPPAELSKIDVPLDAGPESLENIFLYHGLARSLARGTEKRPPLPLDVIKYIMQLAQCIVPAPELCLYTEQSISLTSEGPMVSSKWLVTPPISATTISQIAQLRLDTISKDQGWSSVGTDSSWSWFELAVHSPAELATEVGRRKLSVRSHSNPVASKDFDYVTGTVFAPDHPFWSHVKVGDIIVVHACAKYPLWGNEARKGWLKVWKWYEPTLV